MDHHDNIERYLRGDMTASEMEQFETDLGNNPELNQEFSFQKDVFGTIAEVRKAELKAHLDTIEIPKGWDLTASTATKIIGATLVIGTISFMAYYFSGPSETPEPVTEVVEPIKEETEPIQEETITDIQEAESEEVISQEKEEANPPKPVVPDVIESFDDEEKADSIQIPDNQIFESGSFDKVSVDIQVIDDPQFKFHYQFTQDKLMLYGDFNNVFYEILEIKDDNNGGIYLFYREKFYVLDRDQSEVTSLIEITDEEIKKRLSEIKNKE